MALETNTRQHKDFEPHFWLQGVLFVGYSLEFKLQKKQFLDQL